MAYYKLETPEHGAWKNGGNVEYWWNTEILAEQWNTGQIIRILQIFWKTEQQNNNKKNYQYRNTTY